MKTIVFLLLCVLLASPSLQEFTLHADEIYPNFGSTVEIKELDVDDIDIQVLDVGTLGVASPDGVQINTSQNIVLDGASMDVNAESISLTTDDQNSVISVLAASTLDISGDTVAFEADDGDLWIRGLSNNEIVSAGPLQIEADLDSVNIGGGSIQFNAAAGSIYFEVQDDVDAWGSSLVLEGINEMNVNALVSDINLYSDYNNFDLDATYMWVNSQNVIMETTRNNLLLQAAEQLSFNTIDIYFNAEQGMSITSQEASVTLWSTSAMTMSADSMLFRGFSEMGIASGATLTATTTSDVFFIADYSINMMSGSDITIDVSNTTLFNSEYLFLQSLESDVELDSPAISIASGESVSVLAYNTMTFNFGDEMALNAVAGFFLDAADQIIYLSNTPPAAAPTFTANTLDYFRIAGATTTMTVNSLSINNAAPPSTTCSFTITVSSGGNDPTVSWQIFENGNVIDSGGVGASSFVINSGQAHYITMTDNTGNGWSGSMYVITDSNGEEVATGSPSVGQTTDTDVLPLRCTEPAECSLQISVTPGQFATEVSWEITEDGMVIASGVPVVRQPFTINSTSTHAINMYDTFGDGWNGAQFLITDPLYGFLVESGTMPGGYSLTLPLSLFCYSFEDDNYYTRIETTEQSRDSVITLTAANNNDFYLGADQDSLISGGFVTFNAADDLTITPGDDMSILANWDYGTAIQHTAVGQMTISTSEDITHSLFGDMNIQSGTTLIGNLADDLVLNSLGGGVNIVADSVDINTSGQYLMVMQQNLAVSGSNLDMSDDDTDNLTINTLGLLDIRADGAISGNGFSRLAIVGENAIFDAFESMSLTANDDIYFAVSGIFASSGDQTWSSPDITFDVNALTFSSPVGQDIDLTSQTLSINSPNVDFAAHNMMVEAPSTTLNISDDLNVSSGHQKDVNIEVGGDFNLYGENDLDFLSSNDHNLVADNGYFMVLADDANLLAVQDILHETNDFAIRSDCGQDCGFYISVSAGTSLDRNEDSWAIFQTSAGEDITILTGGAPAFEFFTIDEGYSYRIELYDSGGDGWDASEYIITRAADGLLVSFGSLDSGSFGQDDLSLGCDLTPDVCLFDIEVTNGNDPSSVFWQIQENGIVIESGGVTSSTQFTAINGATHQIVLSNIEGGDTRFADGWDGSVYTITRVSDGLTVAVGSLFNGLSNTNTLYLPCVAAPILPSSCAMQMAVNLGGNNAGEQSWNIKIDTTNQTVVSGGVGFTNFLAGANSDYDVNLFDTDGDGWEGATFVIGRLADGTVMASGTLGAGFVGTSTTELSCAGAIDGCGINIAVGGGSWQSEVSWELYEGATILVAGTTGQYSSVIDPTAQHSISMYDSFGDGWNGNFYQIRRVDLSILAAGTLTSGSFESEVVDLSDCEVVSTTSCNVVIQVATGSFNSEVSWQFVEGGNVLASGGAPDVEGVVADETFPHAMVMQDSFGDGWDDGDQTYTITRGDDGYILAQGSLDTGFSGVDLVNVQCTTVSECAMTISFVSGTADNEVSWSIVEGGVPLLSGVGTDPANFYISQSAFVTRSIFMFDSTGNGWNGAEYMITREADGELLSQGTLYTGFFGVDSLDLSCLNSTVPSTTCDVTLRITSGSFNSEITWTLLADGASILTGGAPAFHDNIEVNTFSDYTMLMFDSFGDGWDSTNYIFRDQASGNLLASGTLNFGFFGSDDLQFNCRAIDPVDECEFMIAVTPGVAPLEISWVITENGGLLDFGDTGVSYFIATDPAVHEITLSDSAGNGWQGAQYTIYRTSDAQIVSQGTLPGGALVSYPIQLFCRSLGCDMTLEVTSGSANSEISWQLNVNSATVLAAAAPNGAPSGPHDFLFVEGDSVSFEFYDTAGDGWNGANVIIRRQCDETILWQSTLGSGFNSTVDITSLITCDVVSFEADIINIYSQDQMNLEATNSINVDAAGALTVSTPGGSIATQTTIFTVGATPDLLMMGDDITFTAGDDYIVGTTGDYLHFGGGLTLNAGDSISWLAGLDVFWYGNTFDIASFGTLTFDTNNVLEVISKDVSVSSVLETEVTTLADIDIITGFNQPLVLTQDSATGAISFFGDGEPFYLQSNNVMSWVAEGDISVSGDTADADGNALVISTFAMNAGISMASQNFAINAADGIEFYVTDLSSGHPGTESGVGTNNAGFDLNLLTDGVATYSTIDINGQLDGLSFTSSGSAYDRLTGKNVGILFRSLDNGNIEVNSAVGDITMTGYANAEFSSVGGVMSLFSSTSGGTNSISSSNGDIKFEALNGDVNFQTSSGTSSDITHTYSGWAVTQSTGTSSFFVDNSFLIHTDSSIYVIADAGEILISQEDEASIQVNAGFVQFNGGYQALWDIAGDYNLITLGGFGTCEDPISASTSGGCSDLMMHGDEFFSLICDDDMTISSGDDFFGTSSKNNDMSFTTQNADINYVVETGNMNIYAGENVQFIGGSNDINSTSVAGDITFTTEGSAWFNGDDTLVITSVSDQTYNALYTATIESRSDVVVGDTFTPVVNIYAGGGAFYTGVQINGMSSNEWTSGEDITVSSNSFMAHSGVDGFSLTVDGSITIDSLGTQNVGQDVIFDSAEDLVVEGDDIVMQANNIHKVFNMEMEFDAANININAKRSMTWNSGRTTEFNADWDIDSNTLQFISLGGDPEDQSNGGAYPGLGASYAQQWMYTDITMDSFTSMTWEADSGITLTSNTDSVAFYTTKSNSPISAETYGQDSDILFTAASDVSVSSTGRGDVNAVHGIYAYSEVSLTVSAGDSLNAQTLNNVDMYSLGPIFVDGTSSGSGGSDIQFTSTGALTGYIGSMDANVDELLFSADKDIVFESLSDSHDHVKDFTVLTDGGNIVGVFIQENIEAENDGDLYIEGDYTTFLARTMDISINGIYQDNTYGHAAMDIPFGFRAWVTDFSSDSNQIAGEMLISASTGDLYLIGDQNVYFTVGENELISLNSDVNATANGSNGIIFSTSEMTSGIEFFSTNFFVDAANNILLHATGTEKSQGIIVINSDAIFPLDTLYPTYGYDFQFYSHAFVAEDNDVIIQADAASVRFDHMATANEATSTELFDIAVNPGVNGSLIFEAFGHDEKGNAFTSLAAAQYLLSEHNVHIEGSSVLFDELAQSRYLPSFQQQYNYDFYFDLRAGPATVYGYREQNWIAEGKNSNGNGIELTSDAPYEGIVVDSYTIEMISGGGVEMTSGQEVNFIMQEGSFFADTHKKMIIEGGALDSDIGVYIRSLQTYGGGNSPDIQFNSVFDTYLDAAEQLLATAGTLNLNSGDDGRVRIEAHQGLNFHAANGMQVSSDLLFNMTSLTGEIQVDASSIFLSTDGSVFIAAESFAEEGQGDIYFGSPDHELGTPDWWYGSFDDVTGVIHLQAGNTVQVRAARLNIPSTAALVLPMETGCVFAGSIWVQYTSVAPYYNEVAFLCRCDITYGTFCFPMTDEFEF